MKFTISNLIFIIIIGFLTIILTFLTSKGGLIDNRFSKISNKITKRGFHVIIFLSLMLITLVLQEINNQNNNFNNAELLRIEKENREEIIKEKIDSTYKHLFINISNAFSKNYIKIDSLKKNLIEIKRNPKKIIVNKQNAPILILTNNAITKTEKGYKIKITSKDNSSTNFKIACYILSEKINGDYNEVNQINFLPKDLTLYKDSSYEIGWPYNKKNINYLYLYFYGEYTDLNNVKYYLNNIYVYDNTSNETSIPSDTHKRKIINAFNRK